MDTINLQESATLNASDGKCQHLHLISSRPSAVKVEVSNNSYLNLKISVPEVKLRLSVDDLSQLYITFDVESLKADINAESNGLFTLHLNRNVKRVHLDGEVRLKSPNALFHCKVTHVSNDADHNFYLHITSYLSEGAKSMARLKACSYFASSTYAKFTSICQGANSFTEQHLHGLIMQKGAKMKFLPEIITERCIPSTAVHRALISQADKGVISYLKARGMSELNAEEIYVNAFLKHEEI